MCGSVLLQGSFENFTSMMVTQICIDQNFYLLKAQFVSHISLVVK